MASYTKLRDGSWGVRVEDAVAAGQIVEVTTKAGAKKTETIGRVIWSGNGVSICPVTATGRSANGKSIFGKRTCKTGGNCSSFGNGRSCGAEDCDGY